MVKAFDYKIKKMKTKKYCIILFSTVFSLVLFCDSVFAQKEEQNLANTILLKDSLFWTAYNNCYFENMQQYFTDDVEFYHDKGGITTGSKDLIASIKNNICGNENRKIRREVVQGSIKVFPMKNAGKIYGAVITGEHLFYIKEKGKNEYVDGLAKFTHLWILKDSIWKMYRLLSYDHGPAPYINKRKEIQLPANILNQFEGNYKGPQTGIITVKRKEGLLVLSFAKTQMLLYPESNNSFFTKERDLTFEFVKGDKGDVIKLIVKEHGEITEEAVFQK